nr:MAG TPA: hypothetical protein [Caudoviricetes sp.]
MQPTEKELKRITKSIKAGRKLLKRAQQPKKTKEQLQELWQEQAKLLHDPYCAWYCAMVRDIIEDQRTITRIMARTSQIITRPILCMVLCNGA